MLRKLLFLSSLLTGSFHLSFGQTPPLLTDASIVLRPANTQGYFKGTFEILLADTVNIQKLEVLLGSDADSSNLVNEIIDFDIPSGQPTGMHYSRDGYHILLATDVFRKHATYFGSVRVKNLSGTWGDPQRFVAN
jgi:hypothetical protein